MGIQGLIPFLKKSTRPANIKEFKGRTVAIDSYCWLHKGAFACAEKLALGEKTDQYVHYCMKYVNTLLSYDVKPIMVFDGCRLPSKSEVEQARRERRNTNRRKAAQLLREGKRAEARDCLVQCVDITPDMALELMNACRERGVDCIVAPYEADSQLAYLNKIGVADVIITEDSDLILFGCDMILFKMDIQGNGLLAEKSKLGDSIDLPQDQFTFEKFRRICILSGCDYLSRLPGVGLAKAAKVFKLSRQTDIRQIIRKVPVVLKMQSLMIPDDYVENFIKAENTFLYQLVYDPLQRKAVPLNPYPDDIDPSELDYAGPEMSNEKAYQIAIGNINVNTGEKMASFDPDTFKPKTNGFNQKISDILKSSIWSKGYKKVGANKSDRSETVVLISPGKRRASTVERPSTRGKEVTILVPVHQRSRSKTGHNSEATQRNPSNSDVLHPNENLLKMYNRRLSGNSGVSDKHFEEPTEENARLSSTSKIISGKKLEEEEDKENSDESFNVPSPLCDRRVKAKPTEAKIPNNGGSAESFTSPNKKNIFAVAPDRTPTKKKFSLDGQPKTPKLENNCRFFVSSPEPFKESKFFAKLKQQDLEDTSDKSTTDVGRDADSLPEHGGSCRSRTVHQGQEDSEVRSKLSAFASRYKSNRSPDTTKKNKISSNPKRCLFSLDDSTDREENIPAPKRLKLNLLCETDANEEESPISNLTRLNHRNVFAAGRGALKEAKDTVGQSDNVLDFLTDCYDGYDFKAEEAFSSVKRREHGRPGKKTVPASTKDRKPSSECSDEDPLGRPCKDSQASRQTDAPVPKKSLILLNGDCCEDEIVLSDEEETEDPLPSCWPVLGKLNSNSRASCKSEGMPKELNKGCRPSGLSKNRGKSKKRASVAPEDQNSSLKQSFLTNFFRSNFALNKK